LFVSRRKQWVQVLKRSDLDRVPLEAMKNRVLCSKHFADKAYMCPAERNTSSLRHDAVPTVWDHSNPPVQVKERKLPAMRTPTPTTTPPRVRATPQLATANDAPPTTPVARGRPRSDVAVQLATARKDRWRLKNTVDRQSTHLRKERARRIKAEALAARMAKRMKALDDLPAKQRPFVNLQLRTVNKKKVKQYTAAEKQDALALYHCGPAAYRHMLKIHQLPSMSTIRRSLSTCMKTTGPCPVLLQAVSARLSTMSPVDKIATIGFDGMHLSEALRYWEHEDRFVGFEDFGSGGRTSKLANQALVVRGINGSWKMVRFLVYLFLVTY
jgi:hypothetical protein